MESSQWVRLLGRFLGNTVNMDMDIDALRIGEVVAVSRFLTPDHIDVTHVPMTYAHPKATWLERYAEMQKRAPIDTADRMARRRTHSNSVVSPEEIGYYELVMPAARVKARAKMPDVVGAVRTAAASMFKRRAHA
jgi:hypothetical protein